MKVNVVAVGKIKEKYLVDAIGEYAKRLTKFCEFKIIEVDEATNCKNLEEKSQIEGELLLKKARGLIIALDGKGQLYSSEQIAGYIDNNMTNGVSEISFLIGGSNGLSKKVLNEAKLALSFGKITFPHQLFRVVLVEQIYRAFTIINGMPYHK